MGFFSAITGASSAALSAVNRSTSIKAYLLLFLLLVGLAVGLWLYVSGLQETVKAQRDTLNVRDGTIQQKTAAINALAGDRDNALQQRDDARNKLARLSNEGEKNAQKLLMAEQKAKTFEEKLKKLQGGDTCANTRLPDGINSMLNEDARQFNDQYR